MDLTIAGKTALLILLAPVAYLYDFATNPNAPPQIFITQWNSSFINHQIEPKPIIHKNIIITRPE